MTGNLLVARKVIPTADGDGLKKACLALGIAAAADARCNAEGANHMSNGRMMPVLPFSSLARTRLFLLSRDLVYCTKKTLAISRVAALFVHQWQT